MKPTYCTINYTRHQGHYAFVARFYGGKDRLYVGSAVWLPKERRFDRLNKIDDATASRFALRVPDVRRGLETEVKL